MWALPGAKGTLTETSISDCRHALHAAQAEVIAIKNRVADFHRAAFVIEQSGGSSVIRDNTAITSDEAAEVVKVSGEPGLVANNAREEPAPPPAKDKP